MIRIAAVPYCNAFPLIHFLPAEVPDAELTEWYPSAMKQGLLNGEIDIALMPVAELLNFPEGQIISDCSIACNGAVRSVLLVSKKPLEQIQTLALDAASKSSNTICRVILRHFYSLKPQLFSLSLNENPNECPHDAFVIIGDRALAYQPSEPWVYRFDLGKLWKEKTKLPLVFAAWITCSSSFCEHSIISALQTARDRGLANIDTVLDSSRKFLVGRAVMFEYYTKNIVYTLGNEERRGMEMFFSLNF